MRFLLFYGGIDALNHFSDELAEQLRVMGHQVYFVDCNNFRRQEYEEFCSKRVNAAICFDGIWGDESLFKNRNIPVINILVDHPMTFEYSMSNAPEKYIQFSPDELHVEYAKRFYHVKNCFFLPHMGSMPQKVGGCTYEQRESTILFAGNYRSYNDIYTEIKLATMDDGLKQLFLETLECMLAFPATTVEDAFEKVLLHHCISLQDSEIAFGLTQAKLLEEFMRMYYRYKVINSISVEGYPIKIVGNGDWDKAGIAKYKNVKIIAGKNFTEIFPYMEQAKISLNVMPWFKAGMHERIFNALLRGSCPLTDESSWLCKNFEADKEIVYYSLPNLDKLPDKIEWMLKNDLLIEQIVRNGYEKVLTNYTRVQLVDTILSYLKQFFGDE